MLCGKRASVDLSTQLCAVRRHYRVLKSWRSQGEKEGDLRCLSFMKLTSQQLLDAQLATGDTSRAFMWDAVAFLAGRVCFD
jgi:hypothetical protein